MLQPVSIKAEIVPAKKAEITDFSLKPFASFKNYQKFIYNGQNRYI
jgi:hypothetical protein